MSWGPKNVDRVDTARKERLAKRKTTSTQRTLINQDDNVDTSFAQFLLGGSPLPSSLPSPPPPPPPPTSLPPPYLPSRPLSLSPPPYLTNQSPPRIPSPIPVRSPPVQSPYREETIHLHKRIKRHCEKPTKDTPKAEPVKDLRAHNVGPHANEKKGPEKCAGKMTHNVEKGAEKCAGGMMHNVADEIAPKPDLTDEEITHRLISMCTAGLAPPNKFVEHIRNPNVRVLICNCIDTYGTIETLCAWVKTASRSAKRGIMVDCTNLSVSLVETLNSIWVDPTAIPVLDGMTVVMMGVLDRFMRRVPSHRRVIVHTDDAYQDEPAMRSLRRLSGAEVTKCTTVDYTLAKRCCNFIINTYKLGWPQSAVQKIVSMSNLDVRWIHNAIRFRSIKNDPTLLHSKDSDRAGETERWAMLVLNHFKTYRVVVDADRWDALRDALCKMAQMGAVTQGHRLVYRGGAKKIGAFFMREKRDRREKGDRREKVDRRGESKKIGAFVRREKASSAFKNTPHPPLKVKAVYATFTVDAPYAAKFLEMVQHHGGSSTDEQHLGPLPERGRGLIASTFIGMAPEHQQHVTLSNIADDLSAADVLEGDYRSAGALTSYGDAIWRLSPGIHYRQDGLARTPRDLTQSVKGCVNTFITGQMQFRGQAQTSREVKEALLDYSTNYADAPFMERLKWSLYIPLDKRHPMPTRDAALYAAVALKMHPPHAGEFSKKPDWVVTPVEARDGRSLMAWFERRCTYPHFSSTAWVLAWSALAASLEISQASNTPKMLGLMGDMIKAGSRQVGRVGEVVLERPPGGWLVEFPHMTFRMTSRPPMDILVNTYSVWLAAKRLM